MIPTTNVSSFTIDHTKLDPGIYIAREGRHFRTFDVRMTRPNREPAMSPQGYHSLEHMMATFLRNHPKYGEAIIACDAMACLREDTRVVMSDGSIKPLSEVNVGDYLMGDDSTPREVLSTCTFTDSIYKVSQSDADPYYCNGKHPLVLKYSKGEGWLDNHCGEDITLTAQEFTDMASDYRCHFKGYKAGYDLPAEKYPIPPYLLGLWLGDSQGNFELRVNEPDLVQELLGFASCAGIAITTEQDISKATRIKFMYQENVPFFQYISEHGLDKYKRIPPEYLKGSKEQRKMLLTGLINSDGWATNEGLAFGSESFEFISDIKALADSLGYGTKIIKATNARQTVCDGKEEFRPAYQHIHITVPNMKELSEDLLPIKIPSRARYKVREWSTIEVEHSGYGKVVDLKVDGNHKFLKDDGTVLHNCNTGFYVIVDTETIDLNVYDMRDIMIECMEYILHQSVVPATTASTCGNYHCHSIEDAHYYAAKYRADLIYAFNWEYTKLEITLPDGKKFADS